MQHVLNIGKLAGIPIRIHWSFTLLLLYVVYVGESNGFSNKGIFIYLIFSLVIFGCVVLHELGHALAARRYGINTRDIILLPIGGVARLEDIPKKPIEEFVIAIAGPLVNVAIAMVLGVGLWFLREEQLDMVGDQNVAFNYWQNFLPAVFYLNVVLPIFNMIPAFPMDGGRVLRALLTLRMKRPLATQIAARLGQLAAVAFFSLGVWHEQYSLLLIGMFVFWSAEGELRSVRMEDALNTIKIGDICRKNFTVFHEDDGMIQVFNEFKKGIEQNFLIFNTNRKVTGVLYSDFITQAMDKKAWDSSAVEHYIEHFDSLQKDDVVKAAHDKMAQHGYALLPVYDENHQLYGVFDLSTMNDFMQKQRSFLGR
jgi:Zn-dependent protease